MSNTDLSGLLRPRSVAIIGASEKNPWSGLALKTLAASGFAGPIHLVNRRGGEVLGRASVTSATAIGEPVDAAFVAVPAAALDEAIEDMAAAGIRFGAVVTSGFAEIGADGAAEQARLFGRARDLGLTLLGPNSLGFVNFVDSVGFGALPLNTPFLPAPRVAVVSQSGATAGILARAAARTNVSLSYIVAMGNEASVGLAEIMEFLVEDASTRSIAVFAETIRDPARFVEAARRALAARKPIVMLKVGVGQLAAAVAQAHTGALVGDDRIFKAVCAECGVVRVETLEQLLHTADFMAFTGVLPDKRFAAVSISGGACEMLADQGEAAGVPFARFTSETEAQLQGELPGYGQVHNPLDITGAAMADPDLFRRSLEAVAADPAVCLAAACFELPSETIEVSPISRPALAAIGKGAKALGGKVFLLQQTYQPISSLGRQLLTELDVPYVASGLGHTMKSVAAAFAWSRRTRASMSVVAPAPASLRGVRPVTELETLEILRRAGAPVIPARTAATAEEAVAVARDIGTPVALKILSPDIAHKTEVDGVRLGLWGDEAVSEGFNAIMRNVRQAKPNARVEGVLVTPMREGGLELFVGVARDPSWGPAIAVGFGGVLVELLQDSSLRLAPVRPDTVREMLGELRGARLLAGYRGGAPADLDGVAHAVAAIGDAALALGPDLASLEVNPLWVNGSAVECLDALAVWSSSAASQVS